MSDWVDLFLQALESGKMTDDDLAVIADARGFKLQEKKGKPGRPEKINTVRGDIEFYRWVHEQETGKKIGVLPMIRKVIKEGGLKDKWVTKIIGETDEYILADGIEISEENPAKLARRVRDAYYECLELFKKDPDLHEQQLRELEDAKQAYLREQRDA